MHLLKWCFEMYLHSSMRSQVLGLQARIFRAAKTHINLPKTSYSKREGKKVGKAIQKMKELS